MQGASVQPHNKAAHSVLSSAWAYIGTYLMLTVGAAMLALANDLFLIPNNVFSGGATGLALIINTYTGLPVGVLVLLINIPLVLAGVVWLGGLALPCAHDIYRYCLFGPA